MRPRVPRLDEVYVQHVLPVIGHKRVIAMVDLSVPTDSLEFYVALLTTTWSVWILLWYGVYRFWWDWADLSHPSNILYLTFALVPQWIWGVGGTIIGTLHLFTRLDSIRRRMLLLFLSFCFWLAVTLSVLFSVVYSTGVVAYGGLALAAFLSYARLYILDAREAP